MGRPVASRCFTLELTRFKTISISWTIRSRTTSTSAPLLENDINPVKEEISCDGVVKGSGYGNGDGLDFTEEIGMMREGLDRVLFCNLPATGRIDIDHPHQFHLFHFQIFL